MKLSILVSALVACTAIAAPAPALGVEDASLSARADMCWTQDIVDTTDPTTSPSAADCRALAADENIFSTLPGAVWIPSEENNYEFDLASGTCGFKGVWNPAGGSLPADQMTVRADMVTSTLDSIVELLAAEGTVSATGRFACMIAGWKTQTGWVNWEIYNVGGGTFV